MRIRAPRLSSFFLASSILLSASTFLISPPAKAQNGFASATGWGTYYKPFAVDSPWNSRPIRPVLGTYQIKKPLYNPTWIPVIDDGALSLGVFMAKEGDPAVTVYGKTGTTGVGDPDTGNFRPITIPRWPADVTPAPGGDGHADIVDTVTGKVHSFYQLRHTDGKWTASMYSWSHINGRGFGDGGHWSQGARASGVPSLGGLIRKNEIDDGKEFYRHALSMTLPQHTLSSGVYSPAYIYPATSTDSNASANGGSIPIGARMMLPANFDTSAITSPKLRKIANTLKLFGAYVVDSNYDTAYGIHVERGSKFSLMPDGKWDTRVVAELELIRAALRQMVSLESWVDGNGQPRAASQVPGSLSMRGTWIIAGGTVAGTGYFDTWQQSMVFPYTTKRLRQINYNNEISKVGWSKPVAGKPMRFASISNGGARIRLQITVGGKVSYDSGYLDNGQSAVFTWPTAAASAVAVVLLAESGINNTSVTRGVLTAE